MEVKRLYEFGPFLLDPSERVLLREGRPVPLTPKALDILLMLVRNEGHLLNKQELLEAVWPDTFVEEGNLTFNISSLRKALGEDRKEPQYVETVPRRGYRFVASVRVREAGAADGGTTSPHAAPAATAGAAAAPPEATPPPERAPLTEAAAPAAGGVEEASVISGAPNVAGPAVESREGGAEPRERGAETREGAAVESREVRESPAVEAPGRGLRRGWLAALVGVVLVAAAAVGLYLFAGRGPAGERQRGFSLGTTVTRLTTTRNATNAVISPDGKYVVYVVDEARQRSLWLRQVATNSHVQLIPPSDNHYLDLFFSRDSEYVYYVTGAEATPPTLHQMPVTGGTPRKLLERMMGPVGLSPDGKRFAFVRGDETGGRALMVADAFTGEGERKLLTRQLPEFLQRPVWSPDGELVACVSGTVTGGSRQAGIIGVRVRDGAEVAIGARAWRFVERVEWLSDGSGVLATTSDNAFGPYQIWHVSYPAGEARKVTSDLSNYRSISLSADSKVLVAVQSDIRPYVWVVPEGDAARARQITSGSGTGNDYWGFAWTPDGRIVYVSTLSGNQDIWVMNADGTNQKQLTFDARPDFDPAVSPDGRHVVFASERSGNTKIWRMDIDGGNPTQLTPGSTADFLPTYTPDGRWVIYPSGDVERVSLWKIPAGGGEPTQITHKTSTWPAVSPDGKLIACWQIDESKRSIGLAVVPVDGGEPVKMFEVSPSTNTWAEIRWTPDGRALTYINTPNGVSNLWIQPLSGGPPRQLTDFKDNRIFRYDWSRDGKQLALSRGAETNDVVLIGGQR